MHKPMHLATYTGESPHPITLSGQNPIVPTVDTSSVERIGEFICAYRMGTTILVPFVTITSMPNVTGIMWVCIVWIDGNNAVDEYDGSVQIVMPQESSTTSKSASMSGVPINTRTLPLSLPLSNTTLVTPPFPTMVDDMTNASTIDGTAISNTMHIAITVLATGWVVIGCFGSYGI
jgi:hypothetical protein